MEMGFLKHPFIRILSYVVIAMQGVLLALLAVDMLNSDYQRAWKNYGKDRPSLTVYLNHVTSEQQEYVRDCFREAENNGAFVIKRGDLVAKDGSYSGLIFGVEGDFMNNDVSFSFRGANVLDAEQIADLFMSQENEASLGVDAGSAYKVGDIPVVPMGEKVVIKKLDTILSDSGSMNGEYTLLIKDGAKAEEFLTKLSSVMNVSKEELTTAMSGGETQGGLRSIILLIAVIAMFLIQVALHMIVTLRSIDKLGKMVMLGCSRSGFAMALYSDCLWCAMISVPLIGFLSVSALSPALRSAALSHFLAFGFLNLFLSLVAIGISLLVIFSIKPVSAIKKRYPARTLYVLAFIGYLLVSIGAVICASYVDKPMKNYEDNRKLMRSWKEVDDYSVLGHLRIGDDSTSFAGDSHGLDQSLFDWYESIHQENGVYLIHSEYYDAHVLETWRDNATYATVPEKPFWHFYSSVNYLEKMGVKIDRETADLAESGVRVYLIPKSWSESEKKSAESWFREADVRSIRDDDIPTVFNSKREFAFIEYELDTGVFTWAVRNEYDSYSHDPVIYICTPQNMTYFESESLRATGLDGYVKLDLPLLREDYLSMAYLGKFGLTDNSPVFQPVYNYMDGLQSDIMRTARLFLFAFLILSVIVIGLMLCLAGIFLLTSENRLNVQKFLGYDFLKMYGAPLSALLTVSILEIALMALRGAKYGLISILVLVVLEFLIFRFAMTRREFKRIVSAFKEE